MKLRVLQTVSLQVSILFAFLCPGSPGNSNIVEQLQKQDDGNGTKLILTPYINSGRLLEAISLSRVTMKDSNVESYSGYFTVNTKFNGNIFFWFFPASKNPVTAPVLLWLNGYSFSDKGGYVKTDKEAARDLYIALTQFFTLFAQYALRDFYLTGESYAGKYIPALAVKIHRQNKRLPKVRMNLKGIAMGNPLTDPVHNAGQFSRFLYDVGLIDEREKMYFEQQQNASRIAAQQGHWAESFEISASLIISSRNNLTYFINVTGCTFHYNILQCNKPPDQDYFGEYVQQSSVRRAIHVGSQEYSPNINRKVVNGIIGDIMKSGLHWLREVLDAPEGYKVLVYSGNLDPTVPTIGTEEMLLQLRWSGGKVYAAAQKKQWRAGKRLVGYVRKGKNLTFLIVRNAGYLVPYDQPKVARNMINTFTSGREFA